MAFIAREISAYPITLWHHLRHNYLSPPTKGKIRKTIHMSCSSNDGETKELLEKVCRRVERDNLFDLVLIVTISKKPDIKKIQNDIAGQLGIRFKEKSRSKRALEVLHRIKNVHQILVILCDVHEGLDLGKLGIPIFGANHHKGCKLLLTSKTEELLSKHMHTQKNFRF
ncbi:putative disease resistance protein [Senna tora]|uniref:Putative disease resistance protein n=1 Tax=Senna tora TaxID=362788 RepID=A0A835CIH3_9FABA|nr:putative disease resistance protein [Senna tora]